MENLDWNNGYNDGVKGKLPAMYQEEGSVYCLGWQCGNVVYKRYRMYIEEGYDRFSAKVMSGMIDPDY